MASILFDKLAFVRRLEQGTVPREQAEAIGEAVHDAVAGGVATSQDVADLRSETATFRSETKAEFAAVRSEMKAEFAAVRSEMRELASGLKLWMALTGLASLATLAGLAATLIKLFAK